MLNVGDKTEIILLLQNQNNFSKREKNEWAILGYFPIDWEKNMRTQEEKKNETSPRGLRQKDEK